MSDSAPSSGQQSNVQESKPAGIDWLATTAGALAAVTSAVLLSTLGAVGTLLGAAVGSVAATIGTNLYSQGLAKSREKVARAHTLARWRSAGLAGARDGSKAASGPGSGPSSAAASDAPSGAASDPASEPATEPEDESVEASAAEQAPSWRARLRTLPWKRIGLLSLAMFLVVVAAITIIELFAGRSLSAIVGGDDGRTTISGVTGDGSKERDQKPGKDPSTGETGTSKPSTSPSVDPSEAQSEAPQQSEQDEPEEPEEPSVATSTVPSAEPTEQPGDDASGLGEVPSMGADQETP